MVFVRSAFLVALRPVGAPGASRSSIFTACGLMNPAPPLQ